MLLRGRHRTTIGETFDGASGKVTRASSSVASYLVEFIAKRQLLQVSGPRHTIESLIEEIPEEKLPQIRRPDRSLDLLVEDPTEEELLEGPGPFHTVHRLPIARVHISSATEARAIRVIPHHRVLVMRA